MPLYSFLLLLKYFVFTFVHPRYILGGYRPSQTTKNILFYSNIEINKQINTV
jgi:hypothetical protein